MFHKDTLCTAVQECDATDVAIIAEAGNKKNFRKNKNGLIIVNSAALKFINNKFISKNVFVW